MATCLRTSGTSSIIFPCNSNSSAQPRPRQKVRTATCKALCCVGCSTGICRYACTGTSTSSLMHVAFFLSLPELHGKLTSGLYHADATESSTRKPSALSIMCAPPMECTVDITVERTINSKERRNHTANSHACGPAGAQTDQT